jgi:hypothetical protein
MSLFLLLASPYRPQLPMGLFRKETREEGIYKEVYVYFLGALIYKMWFIRGVKTSSKMFHEAEGLAQRRKEQL